ncbi:MAG: aspartate kinase [Vampirovibrionales bacterium]
MARRVLKFGGSSVADADKLRHVARLAANTADEGHQVVVVVSAMGTTTNQLVALGDSLMPAPSHDEAANRASGREYDALLATGEMVSTALLSLAIQQLGYAAIGLNGQQAGIHTESLPNRARILAIQTEAIIEHLDAGRIVVVTGFQGVDAAGNITTLGRGGSDTSAVALAAALQADRCDIYTDVQGVYSTDPRIVPEAVRLNQIAYNEMLELARVGAKVLHPRSVETARQADVPLVVRSTFHPEDPGTMVIALDNLVTDRRVTGIACDKNQVRLALVGFSDKPGVAAQVFGAMASHNISVDMIVQAVSHPDANGAALNDLAFTVTSQEAPDARRLLHELAPQVGARGVYEDDDVAKVSIVGAGMIDRPGIAADMFQALAQHTIAIRMIATSEIKISCLVPKAQANEAIQALHQTFFPEAHQNHSALVNEKVGY